MSGAKSLLVVCGAASLLMVGVGMIVALLPQRILDITGSLQAVGYVASVFAFSYVIAQLPVGGLADRFGIKPLLVLGFALCCLSGLVFGSAATADQMLIGRLVQGAGEAPIWALGPAFLAIAYPDAKGRVIGIYNASIHAGLTAGPLVGLLLGQAGAGALPFLVFSGLCLCGGLGVLLFLPRLPASAGTGIGGRAGYRDLVRLLSARDPLTTLSGILLFGAGYGTFVSVLPAYLSASARGGTLSNGLLFALFYASIGLSQLIAGPLSDRYGRRGYMIAGLLFAAAGFVSFDLFVTPWIFLPLGLAGLGLGVFCVAAIAYLTECVPDTLKASVSSSFYLFWGIGYFSGPLAVGALGDISAAVSGFHLLGSAIAAQAAAIWLWTGRNGPVPGPKGGG